MPEYSFHKSRIGKGISYPLKRTALDIAIEEARIEKLGWVYYQRSNGAYVLRAYRFGDSSKGLGAGLATIIVCSVASSTRKVVENAILNEGLPRLLGWLRNIETAGNTRRGSDQFFAASYVDGALHYEVT
jgi:hypothetical protein